MNFSTKARKNRIITFSVSLLLIFSILSSKIFSEEIRNPWDLESYSNYIDKYTSSGDGKIVLDYTDVIESENSEIDSIEKTINTNEWGYVNFSFINPTEGLYNVAVEYMPLEGRGSDIERKIYINDTVPFFEANSIMFERIWKNQGEIQRDQNENDIRPTQVEAFIWNSKHISDSFGNYTEPFEFYFLKGENSIKLESLREPMLIKSLIIEPVRKYLSYEEYVQNKIADNIEVVNGTEEIFIEAEDAKYKSSSTLYPMYERNSPAMSPYSPCSIRMNMIGRENWQQPGQWLRYNIEVPKEGLYKVAVRYRQDFVGGGYVSRSIKINGDYPFEEAKSIRFFYSNRWEVTVLGRETVEYLFHFEEGINEIEFKVTLGEMANILKNVEQTILNLNRIYRDILMITGTVPDNFRDYHFERTIPETLEEMKSTYIDIENIINEIESISDSRGEQMAIARRVLLDLEIMNNDSSTIGPRLQNFKINIGALATWVQHATNQPLEMDWIKVISSDTKLAPGEKNFFKRFYHNFIQFLCSFVQDYHIVSTSSGEVDSIPVSVWVGSGIIGGRDQAQILRQMADDTFTPGKDIDVRVQLVAPGTLLPATLAGTGPDVALQVANTDPVNYAVRRAVIDLAQFDDFDEVSNRFNENALIPYKFGEGLYALPETYSFPMLFYRADILDELGIDVPKTWDDVNALIPELKKRNMDFGMPANFDMFMMIYYQNGGELYSNEGAVSQIGEEIGLRSFKKWTSFYTDYKIAIAFDFVNRFRTGEMPIGIADFTTHNQLSVFAPEIRGRWQFTTVPGTLTENGLNHSVPGTGVACIMMNTVKDKNRAWEFMKWWTGREAQVRFARELESLMGPAARYPVSNLEALNDVPWAANDYEQIKNQWDSVIGIPQVPGGYITPRYIDFAFRSVVVAGNDPGEQLIRYNTLINNEITRKRQEFGLN